MSAIQQPAAISAEAARRVKKGIATFLVLAFGLSSLGYAATIIDGETSLLLVIAPGVAALITRYIFERNARGFGWSLFGNIPD